jgi:hypothetical protein
MVILFGIPALRFAEVMSPPLPFVFIAVTFTVREPVPSALTLDIVMRLVAFDIVVPPVYELLFVKVRSFVPVRLIPPPMPLMTPVKLSPDVTLIVWTPLSIISQLIEELF